MADDTGILNFDVEDEEIVEIEQLDETAHLNGTAV